MRLVAPKWKMKPALDDEQEARKLLLEDIKSYSVLIIERITDFWLFHRRTGISQPRAQVVSSSQHDGLLGEQLTDVDRRRGVDKERPRAGNPLDRTTSTRPSTISRGSCGNDRDSKKDDGSAEDKKRQILLRREHRERTRRKSRPIFVAHLITEATQIQDCGRRSFIMIM
ncbi:unnamed protein product [Nesidiocoris tenuis]|uniref:Uncharacterized protein n=1 Tax=Nesidiocoris tenuis TaxID=355587 RepID=A0A6H5HUP0_9HEMI|nr:unnamed protein product [Nesidiocoris tenuis]